MSTKNELLKRRAGLSPAQLNLLEKRLCNADDAAPLQVSLRSRSPALFFSPRPPEEPALLSYAQQRFWFLQQLEPESVAYNDVLAVRLSGCLNTEALIQALRALARRHEVLCCVFPERNGQSIVQVDLSLPDRLLLPIIDLRVLPATERENAVQQWARQETRRPFRLGEDVAWRADLLRLDEEEYVFLLVLHHIITDAWSEEICIRELISLYTSFSRQQPVSLPDLPVQYTDFAYRQQEWLKSTLPDRQVAYWRRQLGDKPAPLALPTDRPRPPVMTYRGRRTAWTIPWALSQQLRHLSRQEGVTLFMTFLAALNTLFSRYSQQTDILIGTPVAGRLHPELEGLLGCFVNMLVLRTNLAGRPTFRELLQRVRRLTLEAYEHQEVPFEKLVEELQPERDMSRNPFFQVLFNLQNVPLAEAAAPGLLLRSFEIVSETARLDLSLILKETTSGLRGYIEFNTDLFNDDTIEYMKGHFQTLLEGIIHNPEQPVCTLPLLSAGERRQLLAEWNNTSALITQNRSFNRLFEEQVARTPEAIALNFEDGQLTYGELNLRANRLAGRLRELRMGSETVVALLSERGPDLLSAILAIFKAGGAYLPLDVHHPAGRLSQILVQSRAALVLVAADCTTLSMEVQAGIHSEQCPRWLSLEDSLSWGGELEDSIQDEEMQATSIQAGQLAYVIYTSGSTGRPRGAMVEQRGMLNHLFAKIEDLQLCASDIVAQTASQCFDISVWQMLAVLLVGGQVCIYPDEVAHDPRRLLAAVGCDSVSILETVPSFLHILEKELEAGESEVPLLPRLRWVIPTGEALPVEVCRNWLQRYPGIPLLNAYGPTECSDDVSHQLIRVVEQEQLGSMPIGRPIRGLRLYVLDEHLELLPMGVTGEIYIGGIGVGRGYVGEAGRTAEAFLPDPFGEEAGGRLYKTGDLGKYRRDGTVEWVGRIDQQVKLRGYRIELGEIEAALRQHSEVWECVVQVYQGARNEQFLAAFVVLLAGANCSLEELQAFLRGQLPEYMVPSTLLFLEQMPLMPNGKIDRCALPVPSVSLTTRQGVTKFAAVLDPVAELLVDIWAQVLEVRQVGVHDDFFMLGGHSLLATRVVARIRKAFGVEIPLRIFFASPTVAQLAERIYVARLKEQALAIPPLEPAPRGENAPLSFTQQRQWFLDQLDPDSRFSSVFGAVCLNGSLQVTELERSIRAVVQRHEALRTTFAIVESDPVQIVASELTLPFSIIDLQALSTTAREVAVQQLCEQEKQRPYDLARGPLLRVTLLCLAPQEHILLLSSHQIVFDGWSSDIFLQELATLYLAFTRGEPSPLPVLPVQYTDYARWQRQWLQGDVLAKLLVYWKQRLVDVPVLTLPTDRPRPALWSDRAASVTLLLPARLVTALKELSQREGVTLFMVLLAAYQCVLARYSGQQDITVGSPIANRRWSELEGLIGCFTNTLVLRVNLAGNPTFRALLEQVREVTLGAYAHQDLPFEKLVEELQPRRDLERNPLFQALFALQNGPQQQIRLPELQTSFLRVKDESTMFDLDLTLWEERGDEGTELVGGLKYCQALFDEPFVQRIKADLLMLLELVVADPAQRISDLPLLSFAEQRRLLVEWNATQADYARDICIHQLFEAQVERTPDALAVVCGGEFLTYRQLNAQANQLAHQLRSIGVCAGVVVAVYMERALEMVPALLGILKAGGTYVPLETSFPLARLSWILTSLHVRTLITQSMVVSSIYEIFTQDLEHVVCLDRAPSLSPFEQPGDRRLWTCADLVTLPVGNLSGVGCPDELAYIIFTSGSTGTPKGVMVRHRPVINLIEWVNKTFEINASDRVLFVTSLCFDLSVYDIFGLLAAGGSIQVVCEADLKEPEHLLQLLYREPVTFWDSAPAALQQLIPFFSAASPGAIGAGARSRLRLVFLSGDWIPVKLPDAMRAQFPDAEVVSLGGATEATVWSNFYRIRDVEPHWASIPYGKPIQNAQYYILDSYLHPCPPGIPGDLYIGGECLASGYTGDPGLTAQRFIPDPFTELPGGLLYKTGDRARFWADGNIEFLGRIDTQVKIRGFRVEIGEIEAALARHADVQVAVVEARSETTERMGEKRLIAYVVARAGTEISVRELRSYMREQLPAYMVPSAFMLLDALPVTSNGKVDRRRLPVPDMQIESGRAESYVAPATPDEERMADIWAQVLSLARVGTQDNFFEIGGHSLLAVQLIMKVRVAWQVELPLRSLFEFPTVAGLTACVVRARALPPILTSEEPEVDLQAEAVLDPTILPEGPQSTTGPARIFLTGATGFLGTVLLAELLQQTQAEIYCLVRCLDEQDGIHRLQKALASMFLWQPAFYARIVAVKGDLEQPLLGLSEDRFEQLAGLVDVIYHSGALVSTVYSYSELKAANVLGTQEVLRLAARGRVKPLHYVSTLGVLSPDAVAAGQPLGEQEPLDEHRKHMPDGYVQSKWTAEKLVTIAGVRGLPATIYRPGRLTGHSQTGAWRTDDVLCRMIKGCIQLGLIPTIVCEDRVQITPVDYVGQAIVGLSLSAASMGKVFHLDSQIEVSAGELVHWINEAGYPVRRIAYAEWREALERSAEQSAANALTSFLSIFPRNLEEEQSADRVQEPRVIFDTTNTLNGLAGTSIVCPPIDAQLVATYLAYFERIGFLKP